MANSNSSNGFFYLSTFELFTEKNQMYADVYVKYEGPGNLEHDYFVCCSSIEGLVQNGEKVYVLLNQNNINKKITLANFGLLGLVVDLFVDAEELFDEALKRGKEQYSRYHFN